MMRPNDIEKNGDMKEVNPVDYFLEKTLDNEKKYNTLRKSLPGILEELSSFIDQIEGEGFCKLSTI